MKTVLLLGAGEMQVPMILQAREMGLRTVVADYDPEAPGLKYADVASPLSTIENEAIYNLAVSEHIDGICTSSDYPVRTVAYVCRKMGLSGLSEDSAEILTNKFLQRERFSKQNLMVPGYYLIDDYSNLERCKDLIMPVIVKPVDSSASRGVIRVDHINRLSDAYHYAKQFSRCGNVIVEEFIEGREFSVEVLIQDNIANIIAVTEKFTDGQSNDFFVEEKHIIPARVNKEECKNIESAVINGIRAIRLNNSAAHVELKINKRGVFIIEIAGRLGGDYITSDLVPLSTGVNMLSNVLLLSLGTKIEKKQTLERFSGIRFLTPNNYPETLSYLNNINSDKYTIRKEIKEFKKDLEFKSSLDRLGYFIFCTNNSEKLSKLMQI